MLKQFEQPERAACGGTSLQVFPSLLLVHTATLTTLGKNISAFARLRLVQNVHVLSGTSIQLEWTAKSTKLSVEL